MNVKALCRKYSSALFQAALFVVAFLAISTYQARNLLAADHELAPDLRAVTLQGDAFDLADLKGKPALIYFFAPWCRYCSASADNIVRLRRMRSAEELDIIVVALDWQEHDQILEYAKKHELNVPVVMGDSEVARDWKVHGFPTYYVLDSEHRVTRRDFGYSTQLGLLWRSWL
jgi:peroxiredoxin